MKRFQLQLGIKNTGKLGFNTTGNSQTSGRTSTAVSLGKLRNTVGSTSRKFKYSTSRSIIAEAYVKYGSGATSTDYTIKMGAGSYWEMPSPINTLLISCAWASATGAMQVTEES